MSAEHARPFLSRLITPAVLIVLGGLLMLETADKVDARLVSLGDRLWPGYALDLRRDPQPPLCVLEDAEQKKATCVEVAPKPAAPSGGSDDPFGGGDNPFGDPPPPAGDADPFGGDGDNPFGDGGDDPFGGGSDDPFGGGDDDPFGGEDDNPFGEDDPFAEPDATPDAISCEQAEALLSRCTTEYSEYAAGLEKLTPTIRVYRSVELFFSKLARFPFRKHLLSFVLLLGGLQVTVLRAHIKLRRPRGRREHTVSQGAQLLAHVLLAASAFANWRVQAGLTIESDNAALPIIWTVGFSLLALINISHLLRPPEDSTPGGAIGRAILCIPLYAFMAIASGAYFLLVEGHTSGQAIYIHKFAQFPTIYLAVALYVWSGMLLERSAIAMRIFDVLRPWGLPPMILGWLVVVLAAIPTAYSGASGIFVIAAGAVIFEELRRAGSSRQDAVMFTAMSGSLGVVLRPCLVVVLIAALNNEVTTDQLFEKGFLVFGLTAMIFLIAVILLNKDRYKVRALSEALPESGTAMRTVVPYILIGGGVLLGYWLLLDTTLNERTAPVILPLMLLAMLAYEFRTGRSRYKGKMVPNVIRATSESAEHMGALMFLMCASVCLGGVIERMEVMELVPHSFGSPTITMAVLVVTMVIVGMTMDAMGAVILVSITVAQVAYRNGIDPVHFWMMVLVAFELGYLTPPVSLNHLLARQVIGAEAELENENIPGFWGRYRHILVPMLVMGIALLIVAFVPLMF
ncbi:MAG: TRAP-type C4-dicarboxylate transport system permease large subunit [Myxococcota bacterium]